METITMTDKQIIIDGIDVSGCINFRSDVETTQVNYTNACSIGIWQRWYTNLEPSCITSCSCKYNPNCYYKQLKRLEKACDNREDTYITNLNNLANEAKFLREKLQAKEQECEELKIYIESNEQQVKYVETLVMDNDRLINELDQLKFDYAELEKRHNDSFEQFKQLKAKNEELKRQREADKGLITATGKQNYQLLQEYDKLKTALTEIKEIGKKSMREGKMLSGGWLYQFIEQKISEVEDGI